MKPSSTSLRKALIFVNRFLGKCFQPNYFFHGTYMGLKTEAMLNLLLLQIPLRYMTPDYPFTTLKLSDRTPLQVEGYNIGIEGAINKIIPRIMPMVYVEGYESLANSIENHGWPKKPKIIFTAVSYNNDEIFKIWAATNVERGSKLVIGQHGGSLGVARQTPVEQHYEKVCNRFLTWGWKNGSPNCFEGLAFKLIGKKTIKPSANGGLMLLPSVYSNLSYKMISMPLGFEQSMHYLEQQKKFILSLNDEIRKKLIVRLRKALEKRLHVDYAGAICGEFDELEIDDSKAKIEKTLMRSRILVVSCNGTAFLETLVMNYPTVIFFDLKSNELRNSAREKFGWLENVKIFHPGAKEAAKHINNIWHDIEGWWMSPETQSARARFCKHYARLGRSPILEMKRLLTMI